MESIKVSDLSNQELLDEIAILDIQIDAQSKIMSNYRFKKNECIEELKKRISKEEQ